MGYIYGRTDSYSLGLGLLAVTAALALLLTLTVVRRTAHEHGRRPHRSDPRSRPRRRSTREHGRPAEGHATVRLG